LIYDKSNSACQFQAEQRREIRAMDAQRSYALSNSASGRQLTASTASTNKRCPWRSPQHDSPAPAKDRGYVPIDHREGGNVAPVSSKVADLIWINLGTHQNALIVFGAYVTV
jgi:hypothetical protein